MQHGGSRSPTCLSLGSLVSLLCQELSGKASVAQRRQLNHFFSTETDAEAFCWRMKLNRGIFTQKTLALGGTLLQDIAC